MRNLFRLTLIGTILFGFNANASINIKAVELTDSSIIDGNDISVINVFENESTIESVETIDGQIIKGSEIRKLLLNKSFGSGFKTQSAAKVGGEGSGG